MPLNATVYARRAEGRRGLCTHCPSFPRPSHRWPTGDEGGVLPRPLRRGTDCRMGAVDREGLLDELRLLLHPIVLGTGARLFEEGIGQVPLKLVASKTFSTGVLSLTYAPAGA